MPAHQPTDEPSAVPVFTPRQQQVLNLVASGHTTPVIADKLGISRSTVKRHVADMCEAAGVRSRTSLVVMAIQAGFRPR